MPVEKILCAFAILFGAVILGLSILKVRVIIEAASFVQERNRQRVMGLITLHRALMGLFLLGYLAVVVAIVWDVSLITQIVVSAIFLLGAIFVFMGIVIQSKLLAEIQTTLRGIVPICAKCRKIQHRGSDGRNPNSWKDMETYIAENTDTAFSHGLCPDRLQEELALLDQNAPPQDGK